MALSHPHLNSLSERIIGRAIDVHKVLGPGLLESLYEESLICEFETVGLAAEWQPTLPVSYKGRSLRHCYRPDIIVERKIIVEVKSVEKILPVFKAQLLTYMRLSGLRVGLLINFNVERLVDGITRLSL